MIATCPQCGEKYLQERQTIAGKARTSCGSERCLYRRHLKCEQDRRVVRRLAHFLARALPAERAKVADMARWLGVR